MNQSLQSGREYFRTTARITVHYGGDNPETRRIMAMDAEIWEAQSKVEEAARTVLERGDFSEELDRLVPVLKWMDFKLDLIMHHLRARGREAHFPKAATTTNISGSGFGLESGPDLALGDTMLMTFALPDNPSRPIFAAGSLVRVEESSAPGVTSLGVRFLEIATSDQERIIRYTFQKQRQALAERTGKELE